MQAHPSPRFVLVLFGIDSDWAKAALGFPCLVMTFGLLCTRASLSKGLM